MKTYILILTYITCAFVRAQTPEPIGFVEQWVLSKDRTASLKQLVPGTGEYYFFHALHYQQTGQDQKFKSTMDLWRTSLSPIGEPKPADSINDTRFQTMRKRAMVLDYNHDPQGSIKKLTKLLRLELNHQRPVPPEDADIPSKLNPTSVSEQAFRNSAATEGKEYQSLTEHLLLLELKKFKTFDREKRIWFLKEIDRADFPEIPELVLAELKTAEKPSFSSIPGTNLLLLDQLIWLEKQYPALKEDTSFVTARLSKTRPGDAQWQLLHPKKTATWLEQTWEYCSKLPANHNSLKAHVLYHLLDSKRHQGSYPSDLFLSYLDLPRISTNPSLLQKSKHARHRCDLSKSFSPITGLDPVEIDNKLVREYLYQILANQDKSIIYRKYFDHNKLLKIHAEARMMAGADASIWGKHLTPEEFRSFRDRTEVTLVPSNQKIWSSSDDIVLQLDLKNTPALSVRIFEIDALSHIRRAGKNPAVDIKLNGLVPHYQQSISFKEAPLIRQRYALKLPQLKGRGIWVVECISEGVSCRSLVRKGNLQLLARDTQHGQSVTILDENQKPVRSASLWIRDREYTIGKDGSVLIPFASTSRTDQVTLYAPQKNGSGLATAESLKRATIRYKLIIAAGSDKEQLLAGKNATLFARLKLTNNGKDVPLSALEKTTLNISAKLRGDLSTELSERSLKLPANGLIKQRLSIPEDVRSITINFSGQIPTTKGQDPIKLSASETIKINGFNDSTKIAQPLLAFTTDGWKIDLLGRNGEPLAGRVLKLEFWRSGFTTPVKLDFRTDKNGQIHLGQVTGIDSLSINATEFSSELNSVLYQHESTSPDEVHVLAGETIRLVPPFESWLENLHLHCGLFRHHGSPDQPVASMKKHLSIENQEIVIKGLPAGEYSLQYSGFNAKTMIQVIEGKRNGIWISDRSHSIEHSNPLPLHVPVAKVQETTLMAKVMGQTKGLKVIAIGSRYHDNSGIFDHFYHSQLYSPVRWNHGFLGNEILNGRTLSDEYRYILERRSAKKFPGNMLPRPGLLLNPWSEQDSDTKVHSGSAGYGGIPAAMAKRSSKRKKSLPPRLSRSISLSPSLDFLAHTSVVKDDIQVAVDGTINLPLNDFAQCQSVTLVAMTNGDTTIRTVALNPKKLVTRERRLDRNLDPKKHYIGTRGTAILIKGASAEIKNVLDADWKAYTSLAHVYDYFQTNMGGENLRDFVYLMKWPKLTKKQRTGAAHLLASHEFHLFAYFKDRKWFDTNIKPMLANKRHRTFIDDYLLGNDLKPYLEIWKYRNLNAAEKALLAQALPTSKAAIVRDLSQTYEINKPSPEHETYLFTSALKQNSMALRDRLGFASRNLATLEQAERRQSGVRYQRSALNSIVLPSVDFTKTPLTDAIDFLRVRSGELNHGNSLNFVIKGKQLTDLQIKELKLKNVPLGTALQYICDATRTRYRLSADAVEILELSSLEVTDLYTRTFVVAPDFLQMFGEGNTTDAKEMMQRNGVSFPDKSFARYTPQTSTLIVHNTLGNLDLIEQILNSVRGSSSAQSKRLSSLDSSENDRVPRAPMVLSDSSSDGSDDDPFGGGASDGVLPADGGGGDGDTDAFSAPEPELENFFTKVWSESHYYRHSNLNKGPIITSNKFWIEFAKHDGKGPFLSAAFNECTDSTAAALIALALLDLPFHGEKPEAKIEHFTLKVEAKSPMLLFFKDTRETNKVADTTPLLVRQNFFRHGDRTHTDTQGKTVENTVSGKLIAGVPYDASLIITNPTGTTRELQVLTQIPRGSIPLAGSSATEAKEIRIKPHSTTRVEVSFYFPAAGNYPHFPVHVLENGVVLAFAKSTSAKVLAHAEKKDTRSWTSLARDGSNAEVLNRLSSINLKRADLNLILWRLSNPAFYKKTIALLNQQLFFNPHVYAYGFKHGDEDAVRSYLENSAVSHELGAFLDSKLLKVNSRHLSHWEHLEFDPLVNPRQHKFQGQHLIVNGQLRLQYLNILDSIAWKASMTQDDLLTLTYHLFLQDRVGEALDYFQQIDRNQITAKMQYDYLHAYALFYQEKPAEAANIAKQWTKVPDLRWRGRFEEIILQAHEISTRTRSANVSEKGAKKLAAQPQPSLDVTAATGELTLHYSGITKATLRLYAVDLEVLFSENPFLDKQGDIHPSIQPNKIMQINLPEGIEKHAVKLPEKLSYGNVLTMIESGSLRKVLALDSTALQINLNRAGKTLSITHTKDDAPLPRTYIKIYVETTDGETVFFKDGYTDLRGMFAYEAHSRIPPHKIKRYAMLASHPKLGSKILTTK